MMKQLIQLGKAFPNRLFAAICLLLWLFAYGAPAIQKCDCPCAQDKKQPSLAESPTGQVTILWPRQDNMLARVFQSKVEVQIDTAVAGTVGSGAPLTVSVPNGPHKLVVKGNDYLGAITKTNETQITVSAQKPLYYQIIDNGINVTASELDASTALALLPGANTNTWQAISSGTGTVTGTIYFYWPGNGLDFGFLDKLKTDLPVFLDGKRIGAFTNGDYLVVNAPPGEHVLSLDMSLSSGHLIKQKLTLGAGSTRYFHVEQGLDFRIREDSPDEAAEFAKRGLKQRAASMQ
jgi:hypothetical protein